MFMFFLTLSPLFEFLAKLLPQRTVPALLFGGQIEGLHKTKFTFKEIVDRYKVSIDEVNRSLSLSIALALIALYA